MSRWAWLATCAIGCGHPAPPATPTPPPAVAPPDASVDAFVALDDDLPRLADRAVQLYLDWQRVLAEVGTDCAAAATRMHALADANADVIAANQRVLRAGRAKVLALRAELEQREDRLDPAAQAIARAPVMSACAHDPGFARAVDRLAGEG